MTDEITLEKDAETLSVSAPPTTPSRSLDVVEGADLETPEKVRKLACPTDRGWGQFPPACFAGSWTDTLGHRIVCTIAVRNNQECLWAKLSKAGRADKELEVWPKVFSQRSWTWTCGNGTLDWNYSSKNALWWVTFDGRWSRWDRDAEPDTLAEADVNDEARQEDHRKLHSAADETTVMPVAGARTSEASSDKVVPLTGDRREMATKHGWEAMDDSQCDVSQGSVVNVWSDSLTEEGWVYVSSEGAAGGSTGRRIGWLPVVCLEWSEAS